MPYFLVGSVIVGSFSGETHVFSSPATQLTAYLIALPMAAVTGVFPLVRPLSVAAARALCDVRAGLLADGPARTRQAKVRTAGWFTLHLALGGVVSGLTLALTPYAVAVALSPLFAADWRFRALRLPESLDGPWFLVLAPVAGVAMLVAMAGCVAAAGALLAGRAPALLGPTPEDRLAAAERRAARLAVRNRLARELHDSVGHALSAVTLQAGAARRVLDSDAASDVAFVREALAAIEETTRRTVGELDSVLGLLRQDEDRPGEQDGPEGQSGPAGPCLDALGGLLARCGVPVSYETQGDVGAVGETVSREAFRIVQEGLSNALRHGLAGTPVELRLLVQDEELEILMENALPERPSVVRPGGGRGLRGMAERAVLLGGRTGAGPHEDGVWRLSARLPLTSPGTPGRATTGKRTSGKGER
ncbi:histidine kinase [Streptomyces finlayi]|uniref:histidine kinase n=2 Tax=Streptomyces finlayi TaxID=67296 RepID=A0A7G7BVX2_9ACTN|nr:histidine kinase [Streptomyces finlayi]